MLEFSTTQDKVTKKDPLMSKKYENTASDLSHKWLKTGRVFGRESAYVIFAIFLWG